MAVYRLKAEQHPRDSMRPPLLDPLFAPARTLPGIGPHIETAIARLLDTGDRVPQVRDLLFHLPHGVIDRRRVPRIGELDANSGVVTIRGHVDRSVTPPPGSRAPDRFIVSDETGNIEIVYFHARSEWLAKLLPVGEERLISGRVDWFNSRPQMVHPDYVVPVSRASQIPAIEPVYSLTAGLSAKVLRRSIDAAMATIPALPEWLDATLLGKRGWPDFATALTWLHRPGTAKSPDYTVLAHQRIAFDELLASQLALHLVRQQILPMAGRAREISGELAGRIKASLPFSLTLSQTNAIGEIRADLTGPARMVRLLQGDVGSGKTVVAFIAMADVLEAGSQAALMAPTELLARQHFDTIAPLAQAAGISVGLLTGKERTSVRTALMKALRSGEMRMVIGTHALFQSALEFADLGMVVIDEQHRFGVHQRLALAAKGNAPDLLFMTATPIPRTLVLTFYGDMDVTRLTDKPAGRPAIDTRAVSVDRLDAVIGRVGAAMKRGDKIYWICPLVSDSEQVGLTSAEDRYAALQSHYGARVGLVHGQMKPAEKDKVMRAFRDGTIALLVATTVVEVGVDVGDATIIVVEHAERFGLAQLHQLRGRVGRGTQPSHCLLLYRPPLGEMARARLSILRETRDGFRIAEEDLKLRGEGDLLGTRQSGMPGFRIARPEEHADLLEIARDDARLILERDPSFQTERAGYLRLLLYLFGRDDAVRIMRHG